MATIEEIERQISNVVDDSEYEDLVPDLASDVVYYFLWYNASDDDPDEVRYDSGTSLVDLIAGNASRRVLAASVKSYLTMNGAARGDIDEITRLTMDRIVHWRDWWIPVYEDQNFKAYAEAEDVDEDIYTSDYGLGDNGIGDYF